MNFIRILLLILLCIIFINSKKEGNNEFNLKHFEKSLSKIEDNLYASKFEVSNIQYRLFLNELKKNNKIKEYNIAKIDTNKWKICHHEPYVQYYHSHPAYNDYPVVNISYEGANLFCEWLTEKYNSYSKRKFNKVKFRLPTGQEWLKAARGGLETAIYPWGSSYLINIKGDALCNYRQVGDENLHRDKSTGEIIVLKYINIISIRSDLADITAPVKWYSSNGYGLYNMSGNVAEMIIEKGRTKGGSWNSVGNDVKIDAEDEYEGFEVGSPYIGFRYFMEIIED